MNAIKIKNLNHKINFIFAEPNTASKSQPDTLEPIINDKLQSCITELSSLIGLKDIKDFIYEIYAWLEINKRRKEQELKINNQVLHMIFTGNPGTGKTTIARLVSKLFKELGVLSKGHLIEVERADLVGEYIGHTAQKTKEHVKKALGGVLFIDEAYSLSRGGEKDFGKEAIDTLVKAMEDHKHDFILILAGYPQEMKVFLRSNSGLPSRFPVTLSFSDFTLSELLAICHKIAHDQEYVIAGDALQKIEYHLLNLTRNSMFGNARYIRTIIERSIRQQSKRLIKRKTNSKEELVTLIASDFSF